MSRGFFQNPKSNFLEHHSLPPSPLPSHTALRGDWAVCSVTFSSTFGITRFYLFLPHPLLPQLPCGSERTDWAQFKRLLVSLLTFLMKTVWQPVLWCQSRVSGFRRVNCMDNRLRRNNTHTSRENCQYSLNTIKWVFSGNFQILELVKFTVIFFGIKMACV